jgi:hypothetical protein
MVSLSNQPHSPGTCAGAVKPKHRSVRDPRSRGPFDKLGVNGFLILLTALLSTAALAAPYSDAIRARRPIGGEWFGLYLEGKKIGYVFTDLTFAKNSKDKVVSTNELTFRAMVGSNKLVERLHKEQRTYEARPGGRLLGFTSEVHGDGGDQVLEGLCSAKGCEVVRKRPGMADETLHLPPTSETVEDADQVRVALLRNQAMHGHALDGDDLETYDVDTTLAPAEERLISGVKVRLHKVVTLNQKEKVPAEAYVTDKGEMVEIDFGPTMRARAEPKAVAQRLDQVEVFGLTRVVLPSAPPAGVRAVPGRLELVVTGLPDSFQKDSYRQKFEKLPGDKTRVTLLAVAPDPGKLVKLPIAESPDLETQLKSTLAVESADPKIRATAKRIVGGEKDAYAAAKRIVAWVGAHMIKDYGASADRATDVLRQMKGDCTEHSLLAEALLRASGIPARRVDGLVYVMNDDGVPALYWHEWVEAYVGEWTQLDPTFGEPVADATHFAVGEEGNAEITPLIGQLKVAEVR